MHWTQDFDRIEGLEYLSTTDDFEMSMRMSVAVNGGGVRAAGRVG